VPLTARETRFMPHLTIFVLFLLLGILASCFFL